MGPTRRLNEEETAIRKQRQVLEKDDAEKHLEKILFGDEAGFLDALKGAAHDEKRALARTYNGSESEEDLSQDEGMPDVADADLFFLDAGTDLPEDVMQDLREEQDDRKENERERRVLWHDSDDERISVSLASNTRLRKLRNTQDDDVVNGLEYIRRLRRQYERLHPTPEWVKYARKKRRLSNGEHKDSGSDSDTDVSMENSSFVSVKQLADLLRSTASLTRQDSKEDPSSARALKLRPELIDIQRLKDIASSGPSSVDILQFHPEHPLLLTAGPSSTISLYHISPSSQNPNPLVTSLHVKGTPITTAVFALSNKPSATTSQDRMEPPETKIYLSARRRYFHTWSLSTGTLTKISRPLYQSRPTNSAPISKSLKRNHEIPTTENLIVSPNSAYVAILANTGSSAGVVHLLSSTTHQPITQIRIESLNGIADLSFYRDSSGFSVVGKNGEVTEYSIVEQRVTARWIDDGAVGTTALALGGMMKDPAAQAGSSLLGNDRWVAVGSTSGIVNIYDRRSIIAHFAPLLKEGNATVQNLTTATVASTFAATYRPAPLRTLANLTTPISHLHFSPDTTGQLLVLASRWKKNALRLVHVPSCTVYKNWPTDKTPLGRISSVAISPDGGYLVVGNEAGKVRLWQMRD